MVSESQPIMGVASMLPKKCPKRILTANAVARKLGRLTSWIWGPKQGKYTV